MKIGSFLEYLLNEERFAKRIKEFTSEFSYFLKECIICDLIYFYNNTGINIEVNSFDLVDIYYDILQKNKDKLHPSLCEINPSNGEEKFRSRNRNTIISNSDHSNGLQNRRELTVIKIPNLNKNNQLSIVYKLSDELLKFDLDSIEYKKIIFNETFEYMYNFKKFFMSNNIECVCGDNKNIFINIKSNRKNKIPLPISGDFEYKCARCMLESNLKGINKIFK